jgi:hypothetical protein
MSEPINIDDPVWGTVTITDIVLIQLLESKTIERLKWIGQHGPLNHISFLDNRTSKVTRYDHSVGAMILTLIAGGTVDEAIAALLHDIIHTAFSHALDFFLESNAESYHEKYKKSLLTQFNKEMKSILGDNWKEYLNEKRWTVIKTNNPFAIDIAEYTVRDAIAFGFCDPDVAKEMSTQLTIIEHEGKRLLACKTLEASIWWRELSEKTNQVYTAPWNLSLNHYLVCGLKECINGKTINMNELKKVPNSDVENKIMCQILTTTKAGNNLLTYSKKEWKLFDIFEKIPNNWSIVGEFDIRNRIVDPPIVGFEYLKNKTEHAKKILASCDLDCDLD